MSKNTFDSNKNIPTLPHAGNTKLPINKTPESMAYAGGASSKLSKETDNFIQEGSAILKPKILGLDHAIDEVLELHILIQQAINDVSTLHTLICKTTEEAVALFKILKEQKDNQSNVVLEETKNDGG